MYEAQLHRPNVRSAGKRCDGFTLFETLVATLIMEVALVVVLQLFSGGLRANTLANQHTLALFHARQKMEELLLARTLDDGRISGEWEDGYAWTADIASQAENDSAPVKKHVAFAINLTVHWEDGRRQRRIELASVALADRSHESD
jgi:general secretion pathway protein I